MRDGGASANAAIGRSIVVHVREIDASSANGASKSLGGSKQSFVGRRRRVRHRFRALRDEPDLSALRRELATRVGVARVRHAHETALATLWKGFVKVLVAALQDVRVRKRERRIRSHVISSIQVPHVSPHARCAFATELAVKHVHYVCARRRARREKFLQQEGSLLPG